MSSSPASSDPRRQANLRLAWILLSVAVVFGIGFVLKIWLSTH